MNLVMGIIFLWVIYAGSRIFLFKKLELIVWHSIIPIYGTYEVFKKVWCTEMAVVYIVCTLAFLVSVSHSYNGIMTDAVTVLSSIGMFVGWTGQSFYIVKKLQVSHINGILLALFFPIFAIVIGLQKENMEQEKSEI